MDVFFRFANFSNSDPDDTAAVSSGSDWPDFPTLTPRSNNPETIAFVTLMIQQLYHQGERDTRPPPRLAGMTTGLTRSQEFSMRSQEPGCWFCSACCFSSETVCRRQPPVSLQGLKRSAASCPGPIYSVRKYHVSRPPPFWLRGFIPRLARYARTPSCDAASWSHGINPGFEWDKRQ